MNEHEVEKPTQIIGKKGFEKDLLIEFLYKVCTVDVLYNSIYFNSTDDVHNERLALLQNLTLLDPKNERIYVDEINSITKRKMVRKGLQQVGESKVFVDLDGLKNILNDPIRESFNRYLEFGTFRVDELKMLDKKSAGLLLAWVTDDKSGKMRKDDIRLSSNFKFLLFKEIFLDIRDHFISSNEYGLDSYLSIRIRHGTLSGQLRKPFENEKLITQRSKKTGEYIVNEFWVKKLFYAGQYNKAELVKSMNSFCRNVDEEIKELKDDKIQIITENKSGSGLFDFCFSDDELLKLFKGNYAEITDYEAFLDKVLGDLVERTEHNLRKIRDYLSKDLNQKMIKLIEDYIEEITRINYNKRSSEFSGAIVNCKTSIRRELENISNWFYFSRSKGLDEFDFDLALSTSLEILNKICQKQFKPTVQIDIKDKILGRYFTYFVDMVFILLDNVVKHSQLEIEDTKTSFHLYRKDNEIFIKMVNSLSESIDINEKRNELNELKLKIDQRSGMGKLSKEGGTGYFKIQKILEYDLNRKKYEIIPNVNNNHEYEIKIKMDFEGLRCENINN